MFSRQLFLRKTILCHSKCSALIMDVLYYVLKPSLRCIKGPKCSPPQSLFKDHRDVCSSNCPTISSILPTHPTVLTKCFIVSSVYLDMENCEKGEKQIFSKSIWNLVQLSISLQTKSFTYQATYRTVDFLTTVTFFYPQLTTLYKSFSSTI